MDVGEKRALLTFWGRVVGSLGAVVHGEAVEQFDHGRDRPFSSRERVYRRRCSLRPVLLNHHAFTSSRWKLLGNGHLVLRALAGSLRLQLMSQFPLRLSMRTAGLLDPYSAEPHSLAEVILKKMYFASIQRASRFIFRLRLASPSEDIRASSDSLD